MSWLLKCEFEKWGYDYYFGVDINGDSYGGSPVYNVLLST